MPERLKRVVVLDGSEFARAVAVHCQLSYKNSDKHWINSSFAGKKLCPQVPRPERKHMHEYMAFRLTKRRLIGDIERIMAGSDRSAMAQAQKLTPGCEVVELWLDTRLVAEMKPKALSKRASSPAHARKPRKPAAIPAVHRPSIA